MKANRFLAVILTVVMVLSSMTVPLFAADTPVTVDSAEGLKNAIAQATDGTTIKLEKPIELSSGVDISNKKLMIDLNGQTLSSGTASVKNWFTIFDGAEVTFKNGTIDISSLTVRADSIFRLGSYNPSHSTKNVLSLDQVTLKGTNYSSAYGVIYANPGTVMIKDSAIDLEQDNFPLRRVFSGDTVDGGHFIVSDTEIKLGKNAGSLSAGLTLDMSGCTVVANGIGDWAITTTEGKISNSTITIKNAKGGISNTNGEKLILSNRTSIDISGSTEKDIVLSNHSTIKKDQTASLKYDTCEVDDSASLPPVAEEAPNYWFAVLLKRYNTKYPVIVSVNGDATVTSSTGEDAVYYKKNITYTITPDEGWEIESVIVNGKELGAVSEFTLKRVTKLQTVVVNLIQSYVNPYDDVAADNAAVQYVTENGLMTAVEDGKFAPDAAATRALVTDILYMLAGKPTFESSVTINDAADNLALNWAVANEFFALDENGLVHPDAELTLEALNGIFNLYASTTDVAYITADDMTATATRAHVAEAVYTLCTISVEG